MIFMLFISCSLLSIMHGLHLLLQSHPHLHVLLWTDLQQQIKMKVTYYCVTRLHRTSVSKMLPHSREVLKKRPFSSAVCRSDWHSTPKYRLLFSCCSVLQPGSTSDFQFIQLRSVAMQSAAEGNKSPGVKTKRSVCRCSVLYREVPFKYFPGHG